MPKKVDPTLLVEMMVADAWCEVAARMTQLDAAEEDGRRWVSGEAVAAGGGPAPDPDGGEARGHLAEAGFAPSPNALARLSALRDNLGEDAVRWFCDAPGEETTAQLVFCILFPEQCTGARNRRAGAREFWDAVGVAGGGAPSPWAVEGFVNGALAAWAEMAPAG